MAKASIVLIPDSAGSVGHAEVSGPARVDGHEATAVTG